MATLVGSAAGTRRLRPAVVVRRVVMVATGLFFAVWTLGPLYWIIATSLKTDLQVYRDPGLVPLAPTLSNYHTVLYTTNFLLYMKNSIEVAVVTTALSMIL